MAESTALAALTAELLGDVGLLHDRIKGLPPELDAYVQQAKEELEIAVREIELQTGANIAAANKLENRIAAIKNESAEHFKTLCRAEVEAAKVEVRAVSKTVLAETVNRVANEANDRIAMAINSQLAANIAKLKEADGKLSRAVASFGWKWATVAGSAAASGILAVLLAAWLSVWWQRSQVEELQAQHLALSDEVAKLEAKTWGIQYQSYRGQKYLVIPGGIEEGQGLTCGHNPCYKLKE
jgi:hypothetical protein